MAAPTVLEREVGKIENRDEVQNYIRNKIFGDMGYVSHLEKLVEEEVNLATGYIESIVGQGAVTLKVVGEDRVVKTIEVIQAGRQTKCFSF